METFQRPLQRWTCLHGNVWQASRQFCAAADASASSETGGGTAQQTRRLYVKRVGDSKCTESLMLGLINHFRRIYPQVGFFKPVGTDFIDGVPRNVQLMRSAFGMQAEAESMFATDEGTAYQVRDFHVWYALGAARIIGAGCGKPVLASLCWLPSCIGSCIHLRDDVHMQASA